MALLYMKRVAEPPLELASYLTVEEIFDRYRHTIGGSERTHWQVIYLKCQGKRSREIAEVTGFDEDAIRRTIEHYNSAGPEAFAAEQPLPEGERAEYQRKSTELAAAGLAQRGMLSGKIPDHPELEVAAFMRTATEVGGDYYDIAVDDDDILTLAIGDATGHGTLAGMMVIATKALFKALWDTPDILALAQRISRTLKSLRLRGTYMHLTLARYRHGVLNMIVAGMPPILVYRAATGQIEEIVSKGMPLGAFPEYPYRKRSVVLGRGDTVLMMSDGLVELLSPCGERLEMERISDIFAEAAERTSEAIIRHLRRAGLAWRAERPLADDVTLLVVKHR